MSLALSDAAPFGDPVHRSRTFLGERLAQEQPCSGADAVTALPGSAEDLAMAYARSAGLPYVRTLVAVAAVAGDGQDTLRAASWRAIEAAVRGRSLVVVSPTVTTGRALQAVVAELLGAGAQAVHLRIAAPPVKAGCPYGVACPTPEELWANRTRSGEAAAASPSAAFVATEPAALGAATLATLALSSLREAVGTGDPAVHGLCDACLSGDRPLEPDRPDDQLPLF